MRRIAHSLKSNGLDLGAAAFAEGCKELEALAKIGFARGSRGLCTRGSRPNTSRVEAALAPAARALHERSSMSEGQGHILVVDDNRMNRIKLARSLEQQGHMVASAEDGEQALEMLAGLPFDVVLLDIVMPGLDGFQVLERIKNDSDLRDIPVIVISAVDEIDSAVRCIEMRRGRLPAQALQPGAAAGAPQRQPAEEEAARPGKGLPAAGGDAAAERETGHAGPARAPAWRTS